MNPDLLCNGCLWASIEIVQTFFQQGKGTQRHKGDISGMCCWHSNLLWQYIPMVSWCKSHFVLVPSIFCELFKQYFLFMDIYIYSLIEWCKSLCISEFEIISSPPDRWPANKVSFEACPNLWLGQKKYFRKKNISYMKGLQATKIIKGIQCAKKKSVIKKKLS